MGKIGLSLSFCVSDICRGKVNLNDVDQIIAGIRAETDEEWDAVVNGYCQTYWENFPTGARAAVALLRMSNRIYQPRLVNAPVPLIYDGWWVDDIAAIKYRE